jgi:hypothetical protein
MKNFSNFDLKSITNNKVTLIASFVGLFLISLGISILVFSALAPETAKNIAVNIAKKSKINLDAPKVAECPLNGQMFTKAEEDIWKTRRPVAAMIENNAESRPVFGLAYADVVYEAVAEGGITRYMGVFYCGAVAESVKAAPIRSARVYFINMAAGYGKNPIFLHYGGANDFCPSCPGGVKPRGDIDKTVNAYALLDKLGWVNGRSGNDMDGQSNLGFPVIERNQNRLGPQVTLAWEHSVVADIDKVFAEAEKRGFTAKDSTGTAWDQNFKKWSFQDGKASSTPKASDIKFGFWSNQPLYDVGWLYDSATNSYKRSNGGTPHMEYILDKPQVTAKNVVIMFAKEKGPVDNEKHMFYEVTGSGDALIFQNGEVIEGTWKKPSALDREVFYDTNGKEISFVRGTTWIEIVPAGNTINY